MAGIFANAVLIVMALRMSDGSPDCHSQGYIRHEYREIHRKGGECFSCISSFKQYKQLQLITCTGSENYSDYINHNLDDFNNEVFSSPYYNSLKIRDANFITYSNYLFSTVNKIEKLDISQNNMRIIPENLFISLPELLTLIISNNNLTTIKTEYFQYLRSLQALDLSHNSISHLDDPFNYIKELFDIDLSHNKISNVPNDLFHNQMHLENIDLSNNVVVRFDIHLHQLPNFFLDNLDLSHNNLVQFSLNLSENLVSLNLSHNKLSNISEHSMLKAVNIEQIDLSNNLLQHLPTASFRNQKVLKSVNISNNYFSESSLGPSNNWVTFFLNFQALQTVSLDNNLWTCKDLKEIMYVLAARSIHVISGTYHNSSNILGVKCLEYNRNNSSTLNGSETNVNQDIGNEILNEILDYMLPIVKHLETQINETRISISQYLNGSVGVQSKFDNTGEVLAEFRTHLETNSKQINNTIINLETFKANISKSVVDNVKNINDILLRVTNREKHISINELQRNVENPIDANSEIVNTVLAKLRLHLNNNTKPVNQKAIESNVNVPTSEMEINSKLIAKSNDQTYASDKLLEKISNGTNAISGIVIQNLLLFSMLVTMLYILIMIIIKRRPNAPRDELNLVQP